MKSRLWRGVWALLLTAVGAHAVDLRAETIVVTPRLHHLRIEGEREWLTFPETAEVTALSLEFMSRVNQTAQSLCFRQQDVKQRWKIELNGKSLGTLNIDENDMLVCREIPIGVLRDGRNVLQIESVGKTVDDICVGEIVVDDRPRNVVLNEGTVAIEVTSGDSGKAIPCRLTILNAAGTLATVGAESSNVLAVRPGLVYTGSGQAEFGLPAGDYTIYAGRGFEWSLDSVRVVVRPGERTRRTLTLRREVDTTGYVACDTHVHTLTHSGHGDATMEERMLTLAGEGIEFPIATDHNVHIDYRPLAEELGMLRYFTPVIGNEVTTKTGHFNVFPVRSESSIPNYRLTAWSSIFESIYATPDVRVVILNHARDLHSGVRPFGPKLHLGVVGENVDGWDLRANAMEVLNSSATQTDIMQLAHDWFGVLNGGYSITPVGSSDSHDVGRHFVGQGRTYIRCDDTDPGNIDTHEAIENFVRGRVLVSYGLLTEIVVNDRYHSGDLADVSQGVKVNVRVSGPAWVKADTVELFANGLRIRTAEIPDGDQAGIKWSGEWLLKEMKHDVHLVAIARGPGVTGLYWPMAKPYQPDSPVWEPSALGMTGAVWLDVDGDGEPTSAAEYARRLVADSPNDLAELLSGLSGYDASVAAQAARLWRTQGNRILDPEVTQALQSTTRDAREGFQSYIEAWKATQRARVDRP